MCMFNKSAASSPAVRVAAYDNTEAMAQADLEASLRRKRSGAAANILTGPIGIPAAPPGKGMTRTMGGVAQ